MNPNLKWLVLAFVLAFYSLLYIATTKKDECLGNGDCRTLSRLNTELRHNRPYVSGADYCTQRSVCVFVNDTYSVNWAGLIDTTCLYLHNLNLKNYTVNIVGLSRSDTLAKQTCP